MLTARHVRIARELGDLSELPLVLNSRLVLSLWAGQFQAATSMLTEIQTIQEATGIGLAPYGAQVTRDPDPAPGPEARASPFGFRA